MDDAEVQKYISVNPDVCHGKPCFKGTRIMVSTILELLEAGQTPEKIFEGYPRLTPFHVQAALHYAAQVVDGSRLAPSSR